MEESVQPATVAGSGQTIALFRFEEHQKMPLLNLVVVLIVVGVILYLINRYIPMASSIKTILNIVVVVAVCVWVLQAVGLWSDVTNFRIAR
jgi:predicted membrane protein